MNAATGPSDRSIEPGTDPLEAAAVRRVTRRLIPLLFLLYVVCVIDRTNVSFAALQMNRDLGFSAAVYGLGAGIFFLGYALFEVPSNLILARVGARRWIGRIAITWGVLAAAMMLVRGPGSFYLLRFLLGVAEAGYFPGIIYYLSQWFPQRQRARAMSRFTIGIPLSTAVGAPLGVALLGLDGRLGLAGWQWLFLVEGIPAVVLGAVALRFLTDRPEEAGWLPDRERAWLCRELELERQTRGHTPRDTWRRVLTSGAVWRLCLPYVMVGTSSYGLTLWLPMLTKELLQATTLGVALVVGLIGIAGAAAMLLNAASSDRRRERVGHAAAPLFVAAAGCVAAGLLQQPALAVLGLSVGLIGLQAFFPPFWCIPTAMLGGTAAAGGIALINSIGNLGGFLGANLLGIAKERTGGFTVGLLALAVCSLAAGAFTLRLRYRESGGAKAAASISSRAELTEPPPRSRSPLLH